MQAVGQPSRRAPDGARLHDERHRREQTTPYRLVQQHAAGFIARTEAGTGAELPRFIEDEFDAFLQCGNLAHGFLRLRYRACGHDRLLAFGLPSAAVCGPACGGRPMSQTASHRVDHALALPSGRSPGTNSPPDCLCPGALPHVPVRQWALSRPIRLRVLPAVQPELVTPELQVVRRVVMHHGLDSARLGADEGHGGEITLIQRFGSAANLDIHLPTTTLPSVRAAPAAARILELGQGTGSPGTRASPGPARPGPARPGPGVRSGHRAGSRRPSARPPPLRRARLRVVPARVVRFPHRPRAARTSNRPRPE